MSEVIITYVSIADKTASAKKQRLQLVEKVCFSTKVLVLYPYKNALWALRPAKPLGVLSRHPCRIPKPLSPGKGLYYWGYAPKQGCFGCLPKVISKDTYVS